MYERSYGYRYEELGDHPSPVAIAKAVRSDIKREVSEGMLPAHWTYSVRSDSFAGGCSVDVEVRDCPDAWQECDGTVPGSKHVYPDGSWTAHSCPSVWCKARNDPAYAHGAESHQVLTEEAMQAKETLQRIHSAYNHDGSEIQVDYFDVRYYGNVSFEDASSAEFRRREAERLAAKRAARETGEVVGKVANQKRDGTTIVHLLVQTPEGKKVFGCGARVSAYGFRGRVGDYAEVTCSRCAKRAEVV